MKFNIGTLRQALNLAQRAYREYKKIQGPADAKQENPTIRQAAKDLSVYPGDYRGQVNFTYSPDPDGDPDPGEIVWTWVPYEEDHSQGKDRPVILIGRDGPYLLALMLTSKDHNNSAQRDRHYLDIGTGSWDKEGRPSEVKLNRIIRVDPTQVRREGAVLDRATFDRIQDALS
ncbi:MAG: type II toxin-antitoxin system PemK/MazF family toxin [Rothia sp. (in: high G+C Gram-positive bacteria)]|nr:type II toxin-antitoxin system PemK/MazF family toxin [Rothia sp. (in: high G+C Gram-positive bacteria)]